MGRKDPRGNRIARENMQKLVAEIAEMALDEPLSFGDLTDLEVPPTIEQVMQAVHEHRLAREATDKRLWDLLAYARMAGATQQQIVEATGSSPSTVKARLSVRPPATATGEDYTRVVAEDGTQTWRFTPAS